MQKSKYFRFDELEKITKNFAEKVGEGGFGEVYKGVDGGKEIAVKKLRHLQGLDDKAFDNEFLNLSGIQHPNVVQVIGYCHEQRRKFLQHGQQLVTAYEMERVLCFEYVQGGSLQEHIFGDRCDLDWLTCYGIIKGTCEGLNHLHTVQGRPIYHRDLKPANILLDNNMMPKIADLGLSRLVASTGIYNTQARDGTLGYMPPEYLDRGDLSPKFDVFSLGVIIIRIMDGDAGNSRRYDMPRQQFIEHVTKNWKERLPVTSKSSQEINMLQVKTCVDIALRCVEADRNKRHRIQEIINEIKALEDKIKKMSLSSNHPKDLNGQKSSDSNFLAIDPTLELRFLFEPRKDISCVLQLTNKTDGSITFNIKTNKTKYRTEPNKGILPPCSRCYICVTLRAQEEAPPNMQCHDVLHVQCVNVSQGQTSDQIAEGFFENVIGENVVDVVTLPIVYIALDQFTCQNY